jgi:hypothetical protein
VHYTEKKTPVNSFRAIFSFFLIASARLCNELSILHSAPAPKYNRAPLMAA